MTETAEPIANLEALAAVDLGSNSFHMLVARVVDNEVHVVDRIKERVALAEGLDDNGFLSLDARERALACLERFGQRIADIPTDRVRAVGTNTLRKARNARDFLARAQDVLGHPIEVIAGREEARLVYLGVTHSLGGMPERRLVVDIGGGSTECIVGEGFDPILADSLFMGCVSWTRRFFPDGLLTADRFRRALLEAKLEVRPIERRYREAGWAGAVGSSGTINAVEAICLANGWSTHGITLRAMERLRDALVAQGRIGDLALDGMSAERAPVIAGGLAVLMGVFEALGVDHMHASTGALREGVVYDLLGRISHEDVRDRTISQLSARYHVDEEQVSRVADTARTLLEGACAGWALTGPAPRRLLCWAASLHEIGQSLTYSGYHKHSAYLIENSDLPGFSRDDQQALAVVVQNHRRKLHKRTFKVLPSGPRRRTAFRVCLLLRLAVLLNRHRSDALAPTVTAEARRKVLTLRFPPGWLEANSLTAADLAHECETWRAAGYDLVVA